MPNDRVHKLAEKLLLLNPDWVFLTATPAYPRGVIRHVQNLGQPFIVHFKDAKGNPYQCVSQTMNHN